MKFEHFISIHSTLLNYFTTRDRYESYLSHSDPVVLALNPYFVLEYVIFFRPPAMDDLSLFSRNDPTPDRGSQLPRAAALVVSSLGFIHDLRAGLLEPDTVRGTPLDMDQYSRLFGTSRIPTDVRLKPSLSLLIYLMFPFIQHGCRMEVHPESRHIVVLRRGQFCLFLFFLAPPGIAYTNVFD